MQHRFQPEVTFPQNQMVLPEYPHVSCTNTIRANVDYMALMALPPNSSLENSGGEESKYDENDLDMESYLNLDTEVYLERPTPPLLGVIGERPVLGVPHGVHLKFIELWARMHKLTNEMIVSTRGRQLFPPIEAVIEGLDPSQRYLAWLKIKCNDEPGKAWRWHQTKGWHDVSKIKKIKSKWAHLLYFLCGCFIYIHVHQGPTVT